jgi:oligoendopeptidase F
MAMNRLDHLARPSTEYGRHFVSSDLNVGEWTQLEPYYETLAARSLGSAADIEQWLHDWSELQSVIAEESARRYISMTCATDDAEIEKAYLFFVEEIDPKLKPWNDRLARKLLESKALDQLDREHYHVLLRSFRNSVELFRAENIPLETELEKLSQQYQKVIGGMTVTQDGHEFTLQQMLVKVEEPVRKTREEAWRLVWGRRLQDHQMLDDLFDKMLEPRSKLAANAGFGNYRDYIFRRNERFDYTPADCERFHKAVETQVVPMLREILELQRKSLGLESLRPWDMDCDRYGRAPLRPFQKVADLVDGSLRMFKHVDGELGGYFARMKELDLLDLESRKGKAPGGYQHDLSELRLPFIFMNGVGTNDDLYTLLHEGGHAFHLFQARAEPLAPYRQAPIEFCEVASMGMEQLASDFLREFYGQAEAARARLDNLVRIITFLPWCATVDAFQHWIYTHPGHTQEQRGDAWLALRKRFHPVVDYTGLEEYNRYRWQEKLHIFQYPFYYIEYGIAQLGALQLWLNSRQDFARTVVAYKRALALGGSRGLPQLFAAADIRFDFSEHTVGPVMAAVKQEVERLSEMERAN